MADSAELRNRFDEVLAKRGLKTLDGGVHGTYLNVGDLTDGSNPQFIEIRADKELYSAYDPNYKGDK